MAIKTMSSKNNSSSTKCQELRKDLSKFIKAHDDLENSSKPQDQLLRASAIPGIFTMIAAAELNSCEIVYPDKIADIIKDH